MPAPPMTPLRVQSDTCLFTALDCEVPLGMDRSGLNLNTHPKTPVKTVADFRLRSGVMPIRHMDISDVAELKNDVALKTTNFSQQSKALALAHNRNLPPQLLLASLLEEICFFYVKDRNKAQNLFKILCERLSQLQVMSPLSHLDEMSGLRYQRRVMFNKIIRAAMKSMEQGPSLLALPDANFTLDLDRPIGKTEDIIEQQTSRYRNEFKELGILGKGGFGSVFKARNYLDGREYAVKKIRFKHKNTDLELKLLREVKALANLKHTNIVGYNAAWMEYDSPFVTGREDVKSLVTQEGSSDYSDSVQTDYQDSMSIEFCASEDTGRPDAKDVQFQPQHGGFSLAMKAKQFSTVHRQDMVVFPGSGDNAYMTPGHIHLNENHNRSTEQVSAHFHDSVHKFESVHKSSCVDNSVTEHVERESVAVVMEELTFLDIKHHRNNRTNLGNEEVLVFYEEELKLTAEAYRDTTAKGLYLQNHSQVSQSSEFGEESHDIQNFETVFNEDSKITGTDLPACERRELDIHAREKSILHESSSIALNSSLVDSQMDISHMSQVSSHSHHCPRNSEALRSPGHHSNIKLPENLVCLCQEAASSHCPVLKSHERQAFSTEASDASLAGQQLESSLTYTETDTPSKSQSQSEFPGFHFTVSSLLTSEKEHMPSCYNDPSSLFNSVLAPTDITSEFSRSHSYNSRGGSLIQGRKLLREKSHLFGSELTPALSVTQTKNKKHIARPGLKVTFPESGISRGPLTKISDTDTTSAVGEKRKIPTKRRDPYHKINSLTDPTSDVDEAPEIKAHSHVFQNSITLYIQMELCTFTLQEWLFERNSEFQVKGCDDAVMHSDNMRIFHQILDGVDYIHTSGLIHRDLKPRNIFLSGSDLHVKIGDFGLATGDAITPRQEGFIVTPLSAVSPLILESHTTGVGTSAYASPEQLKGSNYDFKSDMYSLGVMLYEMFHVFTTEMERVQEIQKLRAENRCCSSFKKKWPQEAKTVEALTNPVTSERPSAQSVLNSHLFLSQEQQVKLLQRKLLLQQKEMERMRKELIEKDRIISQLRKDFGV